MTNYLPRLFSAVLCLSLVALLPSASSAQTAAEPARETLLNGLRILYWSQPGNPEVLLKLRIHSGAAFDLADKGGMMTLLGDALFPDASTREYVTDELGGRLEVTTTYDTIDVTISGKTASLERMIDLLRGALLTTQLGPENVAALKNARIKSVEEKANSVTELADREIAARLFGSFPYAHPAAGTPLSLAKIDRGDLMLARERFLNADNATIAVIGGVDKSRLIRALRQLLGPWGKSIVTVPATFREPPIPDARVLLRDTPGSTRAEIRLAVRGLKRSDPDSIAADMLALILKKRWLIAVPELNGDVQHHAYLLPGMFIFNGSTPTAFASKAVAAGQRIINSAAQDGATEGELYSARRDLIFQLTEQSAQPDAMVRMWLDVDTYKLSRPQFDVVSRINSADIQRVAAKLFKDQPVATVVVGNAAELKAAFANNVDTGTPPSSPAQQIKKP